MNKLEQMFYWLHSVLSFSLRQQSRQKIILLAFCFLSSNFAFIAKSSAFSLSSLFSHNNNSATSISATTRNASATTSNASATTSNINATDKNANHTNTPFNTPPKDQDTQNNAKLINNKVSDEIKKTISTKLAKTLPELPIDQILSTAIANVYEIDSGHHVFYVDSDANYAILGNMIDLNSKASITEARASVLSAVNYQDLPLAIAIRHVNGEGKRKIAIFTDPDCPFCQRLEQETIPYLSNVTIYYFLYPLSNHATAKAHSQQILCADNPEEAYLTWMVHGVLKSTKSACNNGIETLSRMQAIGEKTVQVEVTPTIVLPNGKVVTGLIPPDYLNQLINENEN